MIPAASARLTFGPCLADIRAETGDSATIATPPGSRHSPLTTSEAPSPYPVDFGSCTICAVTSEFA